MHKGPTQVAGPRPVPGHALASPLWTFCWPWLLRFVVALTLAVAVGYVPYRLYLRTGLAQYVSLRDELSRSEARNLQLLQDIQQLRTQVSELKAYPQAWEQVARDELGLVRVGEVVFKVE